MQASPEPIPSKADPPTCRRPAAFFAALLLTLCPASQAATITGMVVSVADGNTVTVLDADEVQHKIRLDGIDAPEKAQPYGQQSKQSLSDMVFGKTVTVDTGKADRYGREVGKVLVDGVDANLEQLKKGLAWHYKAYEREQTPSGRRNYAAAEKDAAAARLGLWQDAEPVPPWEWRHPAKASP